MFDKLETIRKTEDRIELVLFNGILSLPTIKRLLYDNKEIYFKNKVLSRQIKIMRKTLHKFIKVHKLHIHKCSRKHIRRM